MENWLDLRLMVKSGNEYVVEITEDYEDDKFHIVVFETYCTPYEHYETLGFDTEKEVYDYLKKLQHNN